MSLRVVSKKKKDEIQSSSPRIVVKKASAQTSSSPRVVVKKAPEQASSSPKVVVKKASEQTSAPKRLIVKKADSSAQYDRDYEDDTSYYGGGLAALKAARLAAKSYEDSYNRYYDRYMEYQNDLIDAQLDALLSQINSAKSAVSQQADDAARQAYVNLRSSENTLPQKLSAAGQSGGLAQSALVDLYTNYERSRSDIQRDRMNRFAEIDNTMSQARASSNIQKAQAALELQKQQAEQQYQKELLRIKAAQQQALSRQQHLQEMQQLSARSRLQRSTALEDEAEAELVLTEALESLSVSGDVDRWEREYSGILSSGQLERVLRQYRG